MEKEIIKKPCCPSCGSDQIVEKGTIKDNGVLGPGFYSWVENPYYCCKVCGTHFDKK